MRCDDCKRNEAVNILAPRKYKALVVQWLWGENEDDKGGRVFICTSHEHAKDMLYKWVKFFWSEDGPPNDSGHDVEDCNCWSDLESLDEDQAIKEYFEHIKKCVGEAWEMYRIEDVEINPGAPRGGVSVAW